MMKTNEIHAAPLTIVLLLATLLGCETTGRSTERNVDDVQSAASEQRSRDPRRHNEAAADRASSGNDRDKQVFAAAMIDGKAVHWRELQPLLAEAAGGLVLEEIVLDRMLEARLQREGLTISAEDVEQERSLLLETLHDDANTARRLLDSLRQRRGFGSRRFRLLLHRNAALRALVTARNRVDVTDQAVRRMYDIGYGPKRQPRLIVVPTLNEARAAIERIKQGERFGDVAVEMSTDTSASRGGLLEPISRSDPAYPKALREALWKLDVGQRSEPILLDQQYAVVKFVRERPGEDVPLEDVRDELAQQVTRNQQRLAMDQLARQLLRNASVTVFDDALHESWNNRRGQADGQRE